MSLGVVVPADSKNTNTPAAKFMRTFWLTAGAGLLMLQGLDFVTDWRVGFAQVGIVLFGSLLAACLAFLLSISPANPVTPLTKAIAGALEVFVGHLVGFQLVEFTGNALLTFADQVGRAAVLAVTAAVITYVTNMAEEAKRQRAGAPANPA